MDCLSLRAGVGLVGISDPVEVGRRNHERVALEAETLGVDSIWLSITSYGSSSKTQEVTFRMLDEHGSTGP